MNSTMISSACSKVRGPMMGAVTPGEGVHDDGRIGERHHDAAFAGLATAKVDVLDGTLDACRALGDGLSRRAAGAVERQHHLVSGYVDGVGNQLDQAQHHPRASTRLYGSDAACHADTDIFGLARQIQ